MVSGTTTENLHERAKTIFRGLGYEVTDDAGEFLAERDWKTVYVQPTRRVPETPTGGDLRCFVTPEDTADTLRDQLLTDKPDYDWAIVSVTDDPTAGTDGGYDVIHPPQDPLR
jgi:hypothetical protein